MSETAAALFSAPLAAGRRPTVFIVDDDPDQLALLTAQLERTRRFSTRGFTRAPEALAELAANPPDAVLCDLQMPQMDGLEFTREVRRIHETLPIIIITSRTGDEEGAERALSAGASDFATRPLEIHALVARLNRSLESAPAQRYLADATRTAFDPHGIIGSHPRVEEVREFVRRVAAIPHVSTLLLGEPGTGKNLVARSIHGAGEGSRFRFVEVNCAALAAPMLEEALFGHERDPVSEAPQTRRGLLEAADGGTLFLDEVGALPLELQARLLHFLETRTFRRLGGDQDLAVSLRVVAATNVDLAEAVARGRFREDLYFRLNVASMVLPPLRTIRSDIPAMARHFAARAAQYFGKPPVEIGPEGMELLQAYDWPGNARELRNAVERAMIYSAGPQLQLDGLVGPGPGARAGSGPFPSGLTLDELEKRYIEQALRENDGNVAATAEQLGITRKVLWQRRKKHGLL